jgi:hypothetical protein
MAHRPPRIPFRSAVATCGCPSRGPAPVISLEGATARLANSCSAMTCIRGRRSGRWGRMGGGRQCTVAELQVSEVSPKIAATRGLVRIYASDQCLRQDSNLRSRLRRAWHYPALTSANVLAGDPVGHVLGTRRIAAGHGLAGPSMMFHKPGERPPHEPHPQLVYPTGRGGAGV